MISIYPNDLGTISVTRLGADQMGDALRTTPFGVPFLILEDDAVPTDRTFRNAWEADFSAPHGTGMGPQRWLIQQAEAALTEIAARLAPAAPELFETDPLVITPFDEVVWEGDLADISADEKRARYDAWVADTQAKHAAYAADVDAYNARQAVQHEKVVANFQAQQQADTDRCNELIEQMKAEVLAVEGVQL